MRHLHLIVLPPQDLNPEALGSLRGLGKLLRRGRTLSPRADLSEACCQALGIARQQDWPIAPLTARSAGHDVGNAYWLRLDPVYLDVGMQGLYLRAGLAVDETETAGLHALLAPLFAQHGLKAFAGRDGVLHVRCGKSPALHTTPLDRVDGRQPTRFLPTGEDAPFWARLLHEVQMALHEHPLNQARTAVGKPPVNSYWPWGGGTIAQPGRQLDAIWGDSPLLRQLATALDIPAHPRPDGLEQVLDNNGYCGLVLLEGGRDEATPEATIHAWDKAWFRALAAPLRLGRLASARLDILGPAAESRTLSPLDIWRLWA